LEVVAMTTHALAERLGPPSEADIRAFVETATPDVGELTWQFTSRLEYVRPELRGPAYRPGPWDELRPTEEAELRGLLDDAMADLDETIRRLIVERVVAAGLEFARRHPDAGRWIGEVPA